MSGHSKTPKKRIWTHSIRSLYGFIQWILFLILLPSAIMVADGAFQLFTPSIYLVETHSDQTQITVFRYFGAPIFYNVQVVKTYWISMPVFPVRDLNLSIPNPSNFSIYAGTQYLTWETLPFAFNIQADPTLNYTVRTDSSGNMTAVTVMPLNGSDVKSKSFVRLTYNDFIDAQFINMTLPINVDLKNGSSLVEMSLIVNNTDFRSLYASKFYLFNILDYGNMTSISFFDNETYQASPPYIVADNWVWTSFQVGPHSFENLTVLAVFGES